MIRRPSASALVAGALASALGLAAGCMLLVPGEPTDVRCTEEGAIGPPVCPAGTYCREGLCQEGPPGLGEPCDESGACGPGDRCFDPQSVGVPGMPLCSRPCCSSADCGVGTGLVCAVLGPGKMCLPAEAWGRPDPGTLFAGEPCGADTDCRSGVCSPEGGHCVDACCSDAECGLFAGACRERGDGWTCEPAAGPALRYLEPCESADDCASGLCLDWPDGARRCAAPCCSSEECGELEVGGAVLPILCVPLQRGAAIVHACALVTKGDASLAVGEPCDDPAQCRGGRCILDEDSGQKICSDVCCTDASCGAPHLFACAGALDPDASPPGEAPGQAFDLQCVKR